MKRLNNILDFLTTIDCEEHIHGATDVTGFGLMGHGYQLAKASGVSLKINASKLPVFKKSLHCLEKGFLTKAHRSNEEYTRGKIHFATELSDLIKYLTFDPQTSGGLLLSVGLDAADQIVEHLSAHFPGTTKIGTVVPKSEFDVYVE